MSTSIESNDLPRIAWSDPGDPLATDGNLKPQRDMMGIAAYNRGTQVVRNQTAAQLAEVSPAIEHRAERSRIRELEQQLRIATETTLRDRERAMAVIRSLRVKLDDSRQQCGFWKATARRAMSSITAIRQSWQQASELLRLLPASKVQELRELRDMHTQN